MAKTIKIKTTSVRTILKDRVEGFILVPLTQPEPHYPRVQSNVMPNTYYRVNAKTGKCRAFVTVMPDDHRVAWDTCSKCHTHVTVCECNSGVYHPSSIAFIRATFDHPDWPTVRFVGYSEYFDPYMKAGKPDVPRERVAITASAPKKHRRQNAREAANAAITEKEAFGLTAADIENIDMAKVNAQAEKSATGLVRKVRAKIKRRSK